MDKATAAFYSQNAAHLAGEYGQAEGSCAVLDRVFEQAQTILDVGCGTGRDCAYLFHLGKTVFGVDASPAMLAVAQQTLTEAGFNPNGHLMSADLPDLSAFEDESFDGLLCNAVLMHLPESLLFDTVYSFKRVLRPGGVLLFTLPEVRPDIDPQTRRDTGGRLYSDLPAAKLQLLFERVGFRLLSSETVADPMGREGYTWNRSVLKRTDDSVSRPLHLVESILNRDDKVATYKLALFRALAEIAQTQHHLAAFLPNGKVSLPVSGLAEKWLLYYWPIFNQPGGKCIRQGTSTHGSDVAIRGPMEVLIKHYEPVGGMEAFYVDWKGARLNSAANKLVKAALSKLQSTLWTMPIRHAGGGHFSVFQYDKKTKSVLMDASLWRELCLMGSWIQDATVLRWAELTEQINKGAISTSQVVECLLTVPNAARNVADARRYFETMPDRACVWTDRPLQTKFAVDHAMPFALWRNNDLWNLFPAAEQVNQNKSDHLPSYGLLQRRRDRIVFYWKGLHGALDARFRREAQTLLGRDSFQPGNWENQLFTRFVEAFEITANQRGAIRWEPASASAQNRRQRQPDHEGLIHKVKLSPLPSAPSIVPFHELNGGAYRTHLPIVASLAAGKDFHGFETGDLSLAEELDWIAVPPALIRSRRFVVRVAGDSMEPTLHPGQLLIFEYHRSPRRDGEIVIANLPTFGPSIDGTEAIKRIRQTSTHWIFESDNPAYNPLSAAKEEISHPILGCLVGEV